MAEINNFTEINENFDTVKTLLNSIRAQGILNTSDVDKLLSGINAKLEKINTEEDIDLIKVFLTELKQNLDERYNILVSKFGAIESLFSNLLKNSNDLPKSTDIKELFDIVATNLSVFSREVVSQKESLTDISLRLDAIRSDDSQKKDIIKNITLLKPDLERLNNGFDTIVLSLNDNFKTLAKTISSIDKTEYLDKFSDSLNNIEMSSNALLSAIQLLDKKTGIVDDSMKDLATKSDIETTGRNIAELKLLSQDLNNTVTDISQHYAKIDTVAEKVDASVNIIASLKSIFENSENQNTKDIIENITKLGEKLLEIKDDNQFEEFKNVLSLELEKLGNNTATFNQNLNAASENISFILERLRALDINSNFNTMIAALEEKESGIKNHFDDKIQSFTTLSEANLAKIISNISTNTDSLNIKINQSQAEISSLCEGSFSTLFENISELKKTVSQLDENSTSADNAMFSNISDRLTLFENALKESLEIQEHTTSEASTKLCEQVENIKNFSNVLDYKMDSSVVEISNMTRMFETLKNSVDNVLALNFVDTVKDLRADIYASKQDLSVIIENSDNTLSDNITKDLYGKYELIISKLDSISEDLMDSQMSALKGIKEITENISSSLVDIISYVSDAKEFPTEEIDRKIDGLSNIIKETNMNYVENVRDIVDVIRIQVENNLKNIEEESSKRLDYVQRTVEVNTDDLKTDIKNSYDKLIEIKTSFEEFGNIVNINKLDNNNRFDKILDTTNNLNTEFETKLNGLKNTLLEKISDFKQDLFCDNADKISEYKYTIETQTSKNLQILTDLLEALKIQLENYSKENTTARISALDTIFGDLTDLKTLITNFSSENNEVRNSALNKIYSDFENIKSSIKTLSDETYTGRKNGLDKLTEQIDGIKTQIFQLNETNKTTSNESFNKIYDNYEELKTKLEKFADENLSSRTSTLAKLLDNFVGIKDYVKTLNLNTSDELTQKTNALLESLDAIKVVLNKLDENVDGDMTRQLSIIESNFESLISQMTILNEKTEQSLVEKINGEYQNISDRIDQNITQKLEEYKSKIEETFDELSLKAQSQSTYIQERISDINSVMKSVWIAQSEHNIQQINEITDQLKEILDNNIEKTAADYSALRDRLDNFTSELSTNNELLTQNLKAQLDDMTKYVDSVIDIQTQESDAHIDELSNLIKSLNEKLMLKSSEIAGITNEQIELSNGMRSDIAMLTENHNEVIQKLDNLSAKTEEDTDKMLQISSEIKATELQAIEDSTERLINEINLGNQTINAVKDFISDTMQNKLKSVSDDIEKETDAILKELSEQFDIVIKSGQDSAIQITNGIESIVESQLYNNIEDLKSYLDIKTDSSVLTDKLDNLKIEITSTFESVITDLNKMLNSEVFTTAISDFKVANEILINSAVDRINEKIATFIGDNAKALSEELATESQNIENKLALFDKKFVDTIVDKYEEIKLISNKYNDSFDNINESINAVLTDFAGTKTDIDSKINSLIETCKLTADSTNAEIRKLNDCFEHLRSQISNKSFDEAFQASINKQINSLELLVREQMSHVEDINDLCEINLPDVSELNTLVKGAVLESLNALSAKLDKFSVKSDVGNIIEEILKETKTDIITQFLNIFNQISFISEQEEITEYIQDRHDELITILSHIVTSTENVAAVKKEVTIVDKKLESLKDEIEIINDKISNIISSDDEIDYVYSLQDLESDIANLRIALKEMQDNTVEYSSEFEKLMTSTNNVYKLVESIKDELPDKKSFDSITEDIVSISTRTNKLILASDESYKTLKDNLHDFKLVIDDLDERTRNFAQESGMDRIDSKLNALNSMVQNGAKTNQVFNQVFEYLAEWVDNAGSQINAISNKVETLDDIGQIKVMLADLKAEAEDNSENIELIEALGNVFDKQARKITSLETKLDKIIVENTINNQKNKLDMKPMEDTLNSFLAAIGEKMTSQQQKIDSLESSLEKVISLLDEKNTAQLTKKMGGMDKQIAKLNKSIEKIASHVVEK